MSDPDQPDNGDPLANARREFIAFYSTATGSDALRMDTLINMFTLLTLAMRHPRSDEDPLRDQLEKVTDAIDQAFATAREEVRSCQTFKALCEGDQRRIENVLFEPFPPSG